jgi:hypothetical protein
MRLFCFWRRAITAASASRMVDLKHRNFSVRPCTVLVRPGLSDLLRRKFSLEGRSFRGPVAHDFGAVFQIAGAALHRLVAREHVSFARSPIRFGRVQIRFARPHGLFARSHPGFDGLH